ncbi:MAG TPA: hypothetical protein VMD59_11415, partial [Acidimicrobiales bacterium]|nr:hypothetical protein [Acidimicrobiales bacterium]
MAPERTAGLAEGALEVRLGGDGAPPATGAYDDAGVCTALLYPGAAVPYRAARRAASRHSDSRHSDSRHSEGRHSEG